MTTRNEPPVRRAAADGSRVSWGPWGLIIAGLLVIGVLIFAFLFLMQGSAGPNVATTIDDVTDSPEAYYGETVTVSGEIDEVLAPTAMTIGGGLFDEELLVFTRESITAPVDRPDTDAVIGGDVVQVSGEVRQFVVADFEEDLGVDLDPGLFADWEGRPAVVADTFDFTTLGDVAFNPAAFVGEEVTVNGWIAQAIDDRSFILSANGASVLVVGEQALGELPGGVGLFEPNVPVEVTGTVRVFVAEEFEDEFDIGDPTVYPQLYRPWFNQPTIVASEISPAQ